MIKRICEICKKEFEIYPYQKKSAKFCSRKCHGKFRKGREKEKHPRWKGGPQKYICLMCKETFYAYANKIRNIKFCSSKCFGKSRKGKISPKKGIKCPHISREKSHLWKGGEYIDKYGYVHIHKPNHPFADSHNYVKRANLVMEKMINRFLEPEEVVHHKGTKYPVSSFKNRSDDRPENLRLFKNTSEHSKFHCPKGSKFGIHNHYPNRNSLR